MELLVTLVVFGFLFLVVVLPIITYGRARRADKLSADLKQRVELLECQIAKWRQPSEAPAGIAVPEDDVPENLVQTVAPSIPLPAEASQPSEPIQAPMYARSDVGTDAEGSPLIHSGPPILEGTEPRLAAQRFGTSGPAKSASATLITPTMLAPADTSARAFNWEHFMGAKLFAWIGGLAMFLGVAYFVKYSFDNNLISPAARMALGGLVGLGLVAGGVVLRGRRYNITSQTLCGTGVVVLYTVSFACRAVYHFSWATPLVAFGLMSAITALAFILAARFRAQVIGWLGLMAGFLTPVLLSTGEDAPLGLFGYIALLDLGLLALAVRCDWRVLPPAAAVGTILMQLGWVERFFRPGAYAESNKILVPMGISIGLAALWLAGLGWAKSRTTSTRSISASLLAVAGIGILFGFYYIGFSALGARPMLLFGYILLLDLVVMAATRLDHGIRCAVAFAGAAAFVFAGYWMDGFLNESQLLTALGFVLVYALLHTLAPLMFRRADGLQTPSPWWELISPVLALWVMLIPVFNLAEPGFAIWPTILLVDVMAILLAAATANVLLAAIVLVLTLCGAMGLLLSIPSTLAGFEMFLVVLGLFAAFFMAAGLWLGRLGRILGSEPAESAGSASATHLGRLAGVEYLPAMAGVLPFALLTLAVGRLAMPDPSAVFSLALLLVVMLFAVTRLLKFEWLPVVAIVCLGALQLAWHERNWTAAMAGLSLQWNLGFLALFVIVPLAQLRFCENLKGPWVASAIAGPVQFYFVQDVIKSAWPNDWMGLVPATFALAPALGLVTVIRSVPLSSPARLTQLAWLGGTVLLFVTLIFPIQFDRQWLTIGWALEGAALCWLFLRVPHSGLRLVGFGLLLTAFARLALNPAVLGYHVRAETPVLNWYLYAYGTAISALFASAKLLAPPRDEILGAKAPDWLNTLGVILLFLLVNIEIADYFAAPGSTALTFQFSGHFGRDMTYTIGWSLFAFGLLIVGLEKRLAPARYAALALLGVAVLKLFFHDLARLAQLYRIGALIGVALVAIAASFLYQRFASEPKAQDS